MPSAAARGCNTWRMQRAHVGGGFRSWPGSPRYTTLSFQPPSESVPITHPYHPLNGQQVAIVRFRPGAAPAIVVRLPDGTHAAIALRLTRYVAAPAADPRSLPCIASIRAVSAEGCTGP